MRLDYTFYHESFNILLYFEFLKRRGSVYKSESLENVSIVNYDYCVASDLLLASAGPSAALSHLDVVHPHERHFSLDKLALRDFFGRRTDTNWIRNASVAIGDLKTICGRALPGNAS